MIQPILPMNLSNPTRALVDFGDRCASKADCHDHARKALHPGPEPWVPVGTMVLSRTVVYSAVFEDGDYGQDQVAENAGVSWIRRDVELTTCSLKTDVITVDT